MLDRLSKKKRNIGLLVVLALMGWFFWTIRSVLNPLILGYLLAFVLHPAVLHLERKRGWSRPRAVNVIFLAAALFMTVTLGGIYLQGKQLVEAVAAADRKDDVLLRAEHQIDAFLVKARTWSDRLTGGSKTGGEEGEEGEDQDAEDPAPAEEGGAEEGGSEVDDHGSMPQSVELRSDATTSAGAPPGATEFETPEPGTVVLETAPAEAARAEAARAEAARAEAARAEAARAEAALAQAAPPVEGLLTARGGGTLSTTRGAGTKSPSARPPGAAPQPPRELTLRDLVQAWWKGYLARTEGGAGAVALQNAPALFIVLVSFFGSIASLVALLLLLPIYSYFLLFELERIHRFVRRHIPKDERERVTRIGTQIGGVIANFFRGRLLVCVLKGGVITIGLGLAGAPYALFFGVMAGLMSLVPFVGPMLTFVCAMLFGLQEFSFVAALLWIGGTFLLAEILEGYVFIPKVLGDSLGLHPVVVLVSIFAGGAALGMFGFLIAIPLMAALVILARELLLPALRQFADEDSHSDSLRPVLADALFGGELAAPALGGPSGGPSENAVGGAARPDPGPGSGAGNVTASGPGAQTPARRRRK